jgi:hypothetical protein
MQEPSVNGTIFSKLVNELNQLLADGRLDPAAVKRELKPAELDYLDAELGIASWYPADTYCRMLRLYASAAPGNPREYLIESGRNSARRVIALGLYSQLDDRTEARWEDRVGRVLVTLSGSFFSFGRWEWLGLEAEGEGFCIGVRDAGAFSTELILRIQGFVEQLATRAATGAVRVTHELDEASQVLRYRAQRIG